MTRDEQRLYCYLPADHKLPPPKKTRPGEWFPEAGELPWFGYPWLIYRCESYGGLFEVEFSGGLDSTVVRLVKHIGTVDEHTVRLFMIACAEHVLPIYEKYYTDGAARRAINAAMEYEATGARLDSKERSAHSALCNSYLGRYDANRAMATAWMCTALINPMAAGACAEEASRAIRADKRPDEKAWQLKTFLKIIKRQHKEKQ